MKLSSDELRKPSQKQAGLLDLFRNCGLMDVALIVGGMLLSLISGAVIPLSSLNFKEVTNVLMTGERELSEGVMDLEKFRNGMIRCCLLYFYLGIIIFLASYFANACLFTFCERRLQYLRSSYLRAVMRQNSAWFDGQQTGSLTERMTSGIERVKDGVGDKVGIVLNAIGMFVAGVAIGFYMCWQMALVMMIVVPLQLISMYITGKMLSRASTCSQSAFGVVGAVAEEVISGIKTVIAFNAQLMELHRYEKALDTATRLGVRRSYVLAVCAAVPLALMFIAMAGAFWYGAFLVINGVVDPGAIFGVFWAVLMGTRAIGQAAPHLGVIMAARNSLRDIFSVIDREHEKFNKPQTKSEINEDDNNEDENNEDQDNNVDRYPKGLILIRLTTAVDTRAHIPSIDSDSPSGLSPACLEGYISLQNVHFSYPTRKDVKVLEDLSLEIGDGESVAFVGSSGCGKSTILSLLMRIYDQDQGVITLDGVPLHEYSLTFLRSHLGYVQQEPVIFVGTVADNISMGDESITKEDIEEVCRMANAHDFILKLSNGYETLIGQGATQLSGGQKQRIGIARVLARRPRILLLDEATSALDNESESIVQKALDESRKGRTTISVAHRLSTVRNVDRIIVFDKGSIVEQGNHDELVELEGVYASMVKAQEIAKGQEDTTLDDLEPRELTRGFNRDTVMSEGVRVQMAENERLSARIRQSMVSTATVEPEWELASARDEMIAEGASEASLLDIFRYAKPELKYLVPGFFATVFRGCTFPTFAILYGLLFKLLTSTDKEAMWTGAAWNSLAFSLLALSSALVTLLSGTLFGIAGEKLASRLRIDVYKNILRQDCTYFDDMKHSVGALTARLSQDAPNVQAAVDQRLSETIQAVVSLFLGVVVAFYYGWNMAIIGLFTAVLLVISQSAVAQYLKYRGQRDIESTMEASRLTTECIRNTKTIQVMCRQIYMLETYEAASIEPYKKAVIRGLWQSLSNALSVSFVCWNFSTAYAFGLWLVTNSWTTPFVVFQVIEALNLSSMTMMTAAAYFPEYVRARISASILFKMKQHEPKIDNCSHYGETPDMSGQITLRNVYFSYPNRKRTLVLDGLSLNIRSGRTIALVGKSGCGKSTVIQLLERFYDPLCGSIEMDSHDVRDLSVRHLRDQIALVGQEPVLFNLTIRENIAYGLDYWNQEDIEKAAQLANIHQFISTLPEGYNTMVGARGGNLSGGQKQRIAIARAMVREPKILLLDEATSALDTESEKVVQEALDRARVGRTCLIVAHRLSTIQKADVIVVVKDGRVQEHGCHQTLLARKGAYYRLVQKQQQT